MAGLAKIKNSAGSRAVKPPLSRQPRYNAETEAAIEESKAIMRGEIKSKAYRSLQEFIDEIDAEIAAEEAAEAAKARAEKA